MKCSHKTKSGRDCSARPLQDANECFTHSSDPTIAARRAEGRKAGGATRGTQLSAPPPGRFETRRYGEDEEAPLLNMGAIWEAQHTVALDLLEGVISAREATVRTKVLAALAARLKDAQEAGAWDDE
jgi:hypothetical protein